MKKAALVVAVALEKPMLRGLSQEHNRTKSRGVFREAMRRELVYIEREHFGGWGCSECAWVFNPSGTPTGKSLEEMKQNYEQQRAKDFVAHVCAEHPRAKNTKG
jgi:hypothetical protein